MPKSLCFLIFICLTQTALAQQPVLEWAKTFEAVNPFGYDAYTNGRSVAVDKEGNVYTAGVMNYRVDFDPGSGLDTITGTGPFYYGIYVSKLSPTGEHVWAKVFPMLVEFATVELAVDNSGNVYLTAYFANPGDMDPGPGVQSFTPFGAHDAFVAKLDTDGNFQWFKQFGGPGINTSVKGEAITVDPSGNVILCGTVYGTADFDPGPGVLTLSTTISNFESFIVKLTPDGNLVWAKKLGDFNGAYGGVGIVEVVCNTKGEIYTTGLFSGHCDFDPGAGTYYLDDGNVFIAKFDAGGSLMFAKKYGEAQDQFYIKPYGMDLDRNGNIVTTGAFIGKCDFAPGDQTHILTSVNQTMDSYLLKLTPTGDYIWSFNIGSDGSDLGADLAIDSDNNIYMTGMFLNDVDFDPGTGATIISNLFDEHVIAKYDADGRFIYAVPFRGMGDYGTGGAKRIAVDDAFNIYETGFLSGTVDFDPGPGQTPLSSTSAYSPFVVKLSRCKGVTSSTLAINTCSSYTINNTVYDSSGVYTQTIPNATGCDSVITLRLTIQTKRTEKRPSICEGKSYYAGGKDQTTPGVYVDTLATSLGCDSIITTYLTFTALPTPALGADKALCKGEIQSISPGTFAGYQWQDMSTNKSLVVQRAGLYWVRVTNDEGCSATDSLQITALLDPPVDFLKPVDSICLNQSLVVASLQNFSMYQWSTGDIQSSISIKAAGMYSLTVKGANGCEGKDSIQILPKLDCWTGVFIPSAFTPNADRKNDSFKALVHGNLQTFRLQVYDRMGQLVFQTNDASKGWDGYFKGMAYNTATFAWQCFYKFEGGETQYQKGTVTIIK